jgi:hypothetical protein
MGNRNIDFDKDATCDICGKKGAFDFMGDFICQECLDEENHDEENNKYLGGAGEAS